jgi:hypothetical protein
MNSAIAFPTGDTENYNMWTIARGMDAGWLFRIPVWGRHGNGYIYDSNYIDADGAKQEVEKMYGHEIEIGKQISFDPGALDRVWINNCCAIGLSASFVEPLEATGITFTTGIVQGLTAALNYHNGIWNNNGKNAMNNMYTTTVVEIIAFVWAHYHFSSKDDTPFWKEIRNQKLEDAPIFIQEILSKIIPTLHRDFYMDNTSSFHTGHWFSILHANNLYKPEDTFKITGDQLKYAEYYIKTKTYEIDQVIDIFENHYEYLYRWYNE